jgi:drug/metabolite transporter (DMT)-like permease
MASIPSSPDAGRPLNAATIGVMVVLCLSWGFNQVAVKLALPDIPPLMMATLRSTGGLLVVLLIARLRGVRMFNRDGTLLAGVFAGVLFGLEFVFIYRGVALTTASRATVLNYVAPFFVALGSYPLLGERLRPLQWGGLVLAFIGVALAIGSPQANVDGRVLIGDLLCLTGGVLWAATTLLVKATILSSAPAEKTLAYQLAVSIPILGLGSLASGESMTAMPGPIAIMSLVYQAFWVVGLTYLIWFMLIRTYSASKLSAFTFITPLFGVAAGYFVMNDPISLAFGGGSVLVIAGLALVNRTPPEAIDPLLIVPKT